MTNRGTYKYVCEECGYDMWFNQLERTHASGLRCTNCGSRWVKLSRNSVGKTKLPQSESARKEQMEIMQKKMGKQ